MYGVAGSWRTTLGLNANGACSSLVILQKYTPFAMLTGGQDAVILFFVLSGFVLSLPTWKKSDFNYTNFFVKRVSRIYFPYFFALLLAILLRVSITPDTRAYLSEGFAFLWRRDLDISILISHFSFITNFDTDQLNPAIWSLVHELQISLFYPLILMLFVKRGSVFMLACAFAISFFSLGISKYLGVNNLTNVFNSGHYLGVFLIGGLLATNFDAIKRYAAKLKNPTKA